MTGAITLSGQVPPVRGIKENVLAAHRCSLARVILPRENRKQVDEDLGNELRRAVAIDYLDRIEELLAPSGNTPTSTAPESNRVDATRYTRRPCGTQRRRVGE